MLLSKQLESGAEQLRSEITERAAMSGTQLWDRQVGKKRMQDNPVAITPTDDGHRVRVTVWGGNGTRCQKVERDISFHLLRDLEANRKEVNQFIDGLLTELS